MFGKNKHKDRFSFLIHPRNIHDVKQNYPFLKFIPGVVLEWLMPLLSPQKVDTIKGLKYRNEEITGALVCVFLTAKMMLVLPRSFVKWRIKQAVKKAEKTGAVIVGLGAFTSSLTDGGLDLVGVADIGITNGNAFTAEITIQGLHEALRMKNKHTRDSVIAIVGATGSIGQAVSKIISRQPNKKIIVIGKTPANVENLEEEIKAVTPTVNLLGTVDIQAVKEADIVVVASASQNILIKEDFLKENAIIYDISQPQNVSRDIKKDRKDVTVVDGGLVKTPCPIFYKMHLGLPPNTVFACLAETIMLGFENKKENFSLGKVNIKKRYESKELSEKYGFHLAPLRSFGEII